MQHCDGYDVDTSTCNRRSEPTKILTFLFFLKLGLNSKSPTREAFLCSL